MPLAILLLLLPLTASAHKASDSYLALSTAGGNGSRTAFQAKWDIALRDLDYAIGLDSDADGRITWGELRLRHEAITTYAIAHLRIEMGGYPCTVGTGRQLVDYHTDGAYTVLEFDVRCGQVGQTLNLDYNLFFELDALHRGLVRVEHRGRTRSAILSPADRHAAIRLDELDSLSEPLIYGREGVWHIWTGYDHILFLLSLLLPAVLQRAGRRWVQRRGFSCALIDVVKIVTSFTLAHSLTLSLATLGLLRLPAPWVESAIAASIVVAALNNLYPLFYAQRSAVAFCFGLVHGLGFANVLADLGLPSVNRALALFGFNLGVEVGQLAIVAGFLPLAYGLRDTRVYRRFALGVGSLVIATLGAVWFIERMLDLDLAIV